MSGPEEREDNRTLHRIKWFIHTEDTTVTLLRETLSTVLIISVVALLLFSISGVWPPMVAVESGSMEPELSRGDLVFTVEEHRFSPETTYNSTGVVTHQTATQTGYRVFGEPGDVIIYRPDGDSSRTPVIHRAHFWVNKSENWYGKANQSHFSGDSCDEVLNCPAPHSGFITKGDANSQYDQATGMSPPVRPEWIKGTAEIHIPHLGRIRLAVS